MRFLSFLFLIAILLQSCLSASRKAQKNAAPPYDIPTLPYRALEKNKLDTTYDYNVLHSNIDFKLPDSVLKGNIHGSVEFNVLIDKDKTILGIELIECSLYKKALAVYKFPDPVEMRSELKPKLETFLFQAIKTVNFRQTKAATSQIHKTYCFASLFK